MSEHIRHSTRRIFCSLQYRNPRRFLHSCRPAWPSPVPTAVTSAPASATITTTTTTTRLPVQPSPSRPERYYSSSPICYRPSVETASFAEHANSEELSNSLRVLLAEKEWVLDDEGTGVSKTYWFKTYTKCLDFTQMVGIRSKSKNHHPTITIKSGSVDIHWTTHFPRGLSRKDIDMAQYCDQQAALIGTVQRSDANKCKPTS